MIDLLELRVGRRLRGTNCIWTITKVIDPGKEYELSLPELDGRKGVFDPAGIQYLLDLHGGWVEDVRDNL